MPASELHYFCKPTHFRHNPHTIEFVAIQEFIADEAACQIFWELVSSQFRTRGKFLAVWRGAQFVAVHRNAEGIANGFLLVNAPINWQIDYVVVSLDARGQGIASALVVETLNQAFQRAVPYVMLTSKESLRPLYEACGFMAIDLPISYAATMTPIAAVPSEEPEMSPRT